MVIVGHAYLHNRNKHIKFMKSQKHTGIHKMMRKKNKEYTVIILSQYNYGFSYHSPIIMGEFYLVTRASPLIFTNSPMVVASPFMLYSQIIYGIRVNPVIVEFKFESYNQSNHRQR